MAKKPPPQLIQQPENPFRRLQRESSFFFSPARRALLIHLLISFLLITLNLSLLCTPVFKRIDFLFYDFFLKLRPPLTTHPSIVLIEIAEDSIQAIGRWPWPRHYHAVMTHLLKEFGAKAVVFDMIFSEPSDDFDDGALLESLQTNPNVYLPIVYEAKGNDFGWIHSLEKFEAEAKGLGHINISPDSDGTLRRIKPFMTHANEVHPHLALRVAYDYLEKPLPDPSALPFPEDGSGNLMINWSGKWKDTFRHYSYVDLIKSYEAIRKNEAPLITAGKLKDKICIVGLTAFGHADIKANPLEPAYPAVGVHANVINSILLNQFLRSAPTGVNVFFTALIGILVTILFVQFRRTVSLFLGLMSGVFWAVISFFLFLYQGIFLTVAHPMIMIASLYVFSTLYALILGKKEQLYLFKLATLDGLTGLFVIRHFRTLLNQTTLEAQKRKIPLSLILFDIDFFKKVNDTYGHAAGDMVLKEVAKTVRDFCSEKHAFFDLTPARYGGEEFIIMMKNCQITEALFKVAESLRTRIQNQEFHWEDKRIPVTISLGVATLHEDEKLPDLMVRRADEALYRAKQEGRNRACLEKSDSKTPS